MADIVATREAYERRRTSASAHLAVDVARELGLDAAEVRDAASAARGTTPARPLSPARRIVKLAAAYQAIVLARRRHSRPSSGERAGPEQIRSRTECGPGSPRSRDPALGPTAGARQTIPPPGRR